MVNRTQEEIMNTWKLTHTGKPLVSIQCIAYNHEPYIVDALDGFLIQVTDFPFEVIVHDDASPDRTADIIREYEGKYPKIIKAIYETENQYSKYDGSLERILNETCKGKYIAFCEGDDYWIDANKLQIQVNFLENNPAYSAYYHNIQTIDFLGNNIEKRKHIFRKYSTHVIERTNHNYLPLLGQLASYMHRNYCEDDNYMKLSKVVANGDVKLDCFLRTKGNIYFSDRIMAKHRMIFTGTSWTAKVFLKNDTLYSYKSIKNICAYYLDCTGYEIVGREKELTKIICASIKFFLKKPTKENFEIMKKLLIECDFKAEIIKYVFKILKERLFDEVKENCKIRSNDCFLIE